MSYNFPLGLIGQYVMVAGKALDKGEEQKDQQSMMYTCFPLLMLVVIEKSFCFVQERISSIDTDRARQSHAQCLNMYVL